MTLCGSTRLLANRKSNNGMHPTADTLLLKFLLGCGAAGYAGR
jgi:hypothetical protein